MARRIVWDDHVWALALEALGGAETTREAAEALSAMLGMHVAQRTLESAMRRRGVQAVDLLSGGRPGARAQPAGHPVVSETYGAPPPQEPQHIDIVRAVQGGASTLEALCDRLRAPPAEVRARVDAARRAGYDLQIDGGAAIAFEPARAPAAPVAVQSSTHDDRVLVAAIADTHFGSETAAVCELGHFLEYAHRRGVRHVLHAGDILDGTYYHRGNQHELTAVGYERQVAAALQALPQLDGMCYHMITGNHDHNSYWRAVGMDPGRGLALRAREAGRSDILHHGYQQARLVFGGDDPARQIRVELAHPQKGGSAYALSYGQQKWIERMPGGSKPHVLISGHRHVYSVLHVRNVVAIQPGCWQWQTPWMATQGLEPQVGGVILSMWRDGDHARYTSEWCPYYQRAATWEAV